MPDPSDLARERERLAELEAEVAYRNGQMATPGPGYQAEEPPEPKGMSRGMQILICLVVVGIAFAVIKGDFGSSASDIVVSDQNCNENADGSVHVQGRLQNNGDDRVTIVEYTLTLLGGEEQTSRPFGGYEVPGGKSSLVGEDLNVPPGATWVDCLVEVVG